MRAARKARHAEALIDSLARAQTLARQFAGMMSGLKIANGDTLTIQDGVILPIGQNLEYAMSLARGRDRARIRAALNFVARLQEILDHSQSGVGSRASVDASFLGAVSIESRHLEHACDTALSCALRLDRVSGPAVVPGRHGTSRIVPSAARLLSYAACFLPAADRARYAQEYRSELWELAQSGVGRRGQLMYALRQLLRVLPMGFALRSPQRRSAAP